MQTETTSGTFQTVASVISETCGVPIDQITPSSHILNDLGADSLEFLDIAFGIDKKLGVRLPLEEWSREVNAGKAQPEQYFVLSNLCAHVEKLRSSLARRNQNG
jgi:acyl carrier protein